jgi:membrane-associated phospholipid phosphatase
MASASSEGASSPGLKAQARDWLRTLRTDLRRPTTRRQALRLAAWLIYLVAVVSPFIRIAFGYQDVAFPIVLVTGILALLWVAPRDDLRLWVFYLSALFFFTQLRDAADETSIQAGTSYVLDWEESWFSGTTPSAWLQERLGGSDGDTNLVSFLTSFMHWTWFAFPHLIVLGAYRWARPMAFRVAAIMMGTFFAAVALYYILPTVPPWLAAEQGSTQGIRRVIVDVGPQIFGQSLFDDLFSTLAKPNPNAAMPSLHFAAGFIVMFLGYLMRSRRLMLAALIYSVGMGFSLMYLGEHYFADILVGGAVAVVAAFIVESALGHGPGVRVAEYVVGWLRHWWGRSARRRPLGLSWPRKQRTHGAH